MRSFALCFVFAAAAAAMPTGTGASGASCRALITNKSMPQIPAEIDVPGRVLANLAAVGTQNYKCSAGAWTFVNPEAVLSDGPNVVGTHFFLPEKDAQGGNAVWQADNGCGKVVTKKTAQIASPDDPSGAIPWLRTEATQHEGGCPIGKAKFVLRIQTQGGVAPAASECVTEGEIRKVHYTANYVLIA